MLTRRSPKYVSIYQYLRSPPIPLYHSHADSNLRSVFGDESSAEKFAEHFRELGHEVSVKNAGTWDVIVFRHMVPSHEGITNFENLLQSVAERRGGQNDAGAVLTKAEAGPKELCYLRVHFKTNRSIFGPAVRSVF